MTNLQKPDGIAALIGRAKRGFGTAAGKTEQLAAYSRLTQKLAAEIERLTQPVGVEPIEHDADMDRYYIPVHPDWEVQTKGKGSSFRIANTKTEDRWLIMDSGLHAMIEQMARDIHETVARLITERDAVKHERNVLQKICAERSDAIDIMQEQVKLLRSHIAQACVLQNDGVKRSYVSEILGKALAATEPKESK